MAKTMFKKYRSQSVALGVVFLAVAILLPLSLIGASVADFSARNFRINETDNSSDKEYIEGEVLVKFKSKIDLDSRIGKIRSNITTIFNSIKKEKDIKESNISIFQIKDSKTVEQKIKELEKNSDIEYAQPNYQYHTMATKVFSNDTYLGRLWGLHNTGQSLEGTTGISDSDIDALEMWNLEKSSWDIITVAVIDTGVAYEHPDLTNNMVAGYDYVDGDTTPFDDNGHGTHIAGIIAGETNNSSGMSGVSYRNNLKVMPLRSSLTSAQNIQAINHAQANGAKVINASWGCYGTDQGGSHAVCGTNYAYNDQAMIEAIEGFSGLFVVAAGNGDGDDDPGGDDHDGGQTLHSYPCDHTLDNIICVAATNQNDSLASFSDYGATSVDVAAPGVNIYSASLKSTFLDEDFEEVIPPDIPTGFTAKDDWGTYNLGGDWGIVLKGDVNTPYAQTANSIATSPTYDLSDSGGGAKINFWAQCDTEYNSTFWTDYMALEVSSDGISFTELNLGLGNGKFDEWFIDVLNGELPLDDAGAASYHFQNVSIPSQYLTNNFKFRFRWIANGNADTGSAGYGCLVDDIVITKYNGLDNEFIYMSGTSMATPFTAALAGMIWSYDSSLTTAQVKDVILTTGDDKASLAGTTVTGKRINAYGALKSLDTVDPTGSVRTNSNATYTRSKYATLNINSTDAGFGVEKMKISNNSFAWTGWKDPKKEYKRWNLTNTSYGGVVKQGRKCVYVKFKDKVGNVSVVKKDCIKYDKRAPIGSIKINRNNKVIRSKKATLYLSASDGVSGVNKMRISNNGRKWTSWLNYKTKYYKWNLTSTRYGGNLKKGTKYTYVQYKDKAGNVSSKKRDSIIYR